MLKVIYSLVLVIMFCANSLFAQNVFVQKKIDSVKSIRSDMMDKGTQDRSQYRKPNSVRRKKASLSEKIDCMEDKINELYKILERQDYILTHPEEKITNVESIEVETSYNPSVDEAIANNIDTLDEKSRKAKKYSALHAQKTSPPTFSEESVEHAKKPQSSSFNEDEVGGYINDEAKLSSLDPKAQERELYDKAFNAMRINNFDSSRDMFFEFIANYPNSELLANAHYWIGEIYYKKEDFKDASNHYLLSYQAHDKGVKAADSVFKLALCLESLGNISGACATFAQLFSSFDGLPQDLRRAAIIEVSKLRCNFSLDE